MPNKHSRIHGAEIVKLSRKNPTRYRFRPGLIKHKGKMMEERLGFVGGKKHGKVVEIAFIPKIRKRRKK